MTWKVREHAEAPEVSLEGSGGGDGTGSARFGSAWPELPPEKELSVAISDQLRLLWNQYEQVVEVGGDGSAAVVVALLAQHAWLRDYRDRLINAGLIAEWV